VTNSPTSPRSVTFVDSPRAAKAREASAGRSRLSIASVPTENTPLTEDIGTGNREGVSRASTASLYSTVSLHPRTGLPPGAAPAAPPPLLVDVNVGPNYHGQAAAETMREIPPLYHTIRRDTSSTENWEDAMDDEGNESSIGQAL